MELQLCGQALLHGGKTFGGLTGEAPSAGALEDPWKAPGGSTVPGPPGGQAAPLQRPYVYFWQLPKSAQDSLPLLMELLVLSGPLTGWLSPSVPGL